jgi:hypothetical protein
MHREIVVDWLDLGIVALEKQQQLAIDVELELCKSTVADPDRT